MENETKVSSVYVNSVKMVSSAYDVFLEFLRREPVMDDKGEVSSDRIESIIKIYMSPQHFKAFVNAANNQLETLEKKFGELKLLGTRKDATEQGK